MTLSTVMTTANRAPKQNYVWSTLQYCQLAGIRPVLFPTDPDINWLRPKLVGLSPDVRIPSQRLNRVQNGYTALLGAPEADWVLHLEDDVRPCHDAAGSVLRWLQRHAREDRRIVLFWCHDAYPSIGVGDHSIARRFGAVALAMRHADAVSCGLWCRQQAPVWRSGSARLRGFDKMIAAWHRVAYPDIPAVSVSLPSLFQHIGAQSSLSHLAPRGRFEQSPTFTGEAYG